MKKLMFDDKYGLTKAVLSKSKTMTRRIIPLTEEDRKYLETAFDWDLREAVILDRYARYKVGDEVAISQTYKDILESQYLPSAKENEVISLVEKNHIGCTNKMYVRADLMPHSIRITNVRIERLQDISKDDCMREGIIRRDDMINYRMEEIVRYTFEGSFENKIWKCYKTPREAFAALIDKVSRRGTWEKNPWVFVFEFELV